MSNFNKELVQLHNIMKEQTAPHTLSEYIDKYPDRLVRDVKDLLAKEKLTSLINGDTACYDATILEDGTELFVEVTLDDSGHVEDCYCTCNTGFCIHLAAVLWKINEELNRRASPVLP